MSQCKLLGGLNSGCVWLLLFSFFGVGGTGWNLMVGREESDGFFFSFYIWSWFCSLKHVRQKTNKTKQTKPALRVNSACRPLLSQPKSEHCVPTLRSRKLQRLYNSIFDTLKWMSFLKGWGHVWVFRIHTYIHILVCMYVCIHTHTHTYVYMRHTYIYIKLFCKIKGKYRLSWCLPSLVLSFLVYFVC